MKRDEKVIPKISSKSRNKTIDMVTRLYVHFIRTDNDISSQEVSILYSLLVNLFQNVNISWEVYVRQIMDSQFDIEDVISYLKENLILFDKVRIILSLIVLANSDNDFEISEITNILDLCKKLNIDNQGFMNLINFFEYQSQDTLSIGTFDVFSQAHKSLFSDLVYFGKAPACEVLFRSASISDHEMLLMSIDKYIFVCAGPRPHGVVNGRNLQANEVVLLSENVVLMLGDVPFPHDILQTIYQSRETYDVIDFKKPDYNFKIINDKNRYSLTLSQGIVYVNAKTIPYNREIPVFLDDIIQIKGYAPFSITNVIQERKNIGVESVIPKELFINFENDFFNISRVESSRSFAYIEIKDNEYFLYPPKRGWTVFLNEEKVEELVPLRLNVDILSINKRNFRINNYYDLVEIPFEISRLSCMDLKHYFRDGQLALDSISFDVRQGELVGILGQSGCGKSTLLKALTADFIPSYGVVQIDGKNLYSNVSYFTQHFGYVPQEDLLFSHLTVYENLLYRGRLRMPKISQEHLDQKINNILNQTNLAHRKHTQVGDFKKKLLSGGERKRLNIALEMLFEPTVLICDEPTSGLSSSDTEQIIDLLKNLTTQGKIVIITIHQPNSLIFKKFNKVLLMDNGGREVFFGSTDEVFEYFDQEVKHLTVRKTEILQKRDMLMPDFFYDLISYPLYKRDGEITYEQMNQQVAIKRRFSPEYWRDKYKRKMLYELIQHDATTTQMAPKATRSKRQKLDLRSHVIQFLTYIERNLRLKFRNPTNNYITFLEAPLLGIVIAFILRLAPEATKYSFYDNTNIGTHIFVSIIVFVFFGLSNSLEEILSDRKHILREKMMNLRMAYYFLSKWFALAITSILQILLYIAVSTLILGIRGLFWDTFLFYFFASMIGYSLGLLISSFLYDSKSIINVLPLVLIPQIIFGGAIIEYDKMNQRLKILEKSPIPEVVQVIPSRWLFEGLFTAQGVNNPYNAKLTALEKKRLTLADQLKKGIISMSDYSSKVDVIYQKKAKVSQMFPIERYSNRYTTLAVDMMDGRFFNTNKNVFLSSHKHLFKWRMRTWNFNLLILMIYIIGMNFITLLRLKFYYKE